MANKSINNLPVVLQTTAIKNFFESTVDQLYSKANTEIIKGYIGKKQGNSANLSGAFIPHDDADRFHYALSPAVNNINSVTGDSENVVFFDEFIDILESFGVDTSNQNLLFSTEFRTFMPPVDIDKFINYQEYFWSPGGPSVVTVVPTNAAPLDLQRDVLGQKTFAFDEGTTTPVLNGMTLRNGMHVTFSGDYVTPSSTADAAVRAGVEYIVSGVGSSINLTPAAVNDNTLYNGDHAETPDYILVERGSIVATAWSRINHWYHISNFTDVGDNMPAKEFRAKRPIIELDRRLELFNHGKTYAGTVTALIAEDASSDIVGQANYTVDGYILQSGDTVIFLNENSNEIYTVSGTGSAIQLTLTATLEVDDTVDIQTGLSFGGADYVYTTSGLQKTQQKTGPNVAPLFQLYDDNTNSLSDAGLYPNTSFAGNTIFGYQKGNGAVDSVLGFPLSYKQFKNASEISFENALETSVYFYTPFGSTEQKQVNGSYYYKLLGTDEEYMTCWQTPAQLSEQHILTTYEIDSTVVADNTLVYDVGAVPREDVTTSSGYAITVKHNGTTISGYTYENSTIKFDNFVFSTGDLLEIAVLSDSGITEINQSRFDIPLSWRADPAKNEIEIIAEPEYIPHFKDFIEQQPGFQGDPLSVNNFNSISTDISRATKIVQSNEDLALGAFLLDDQPHNIIDALRFTAKEYDRYKNRLVNEIKNYNNLFDVADFSNEYILEQVLRNLISFSIGKDVFGTTYILPFGDNYSMEEFDVTDVTEFEYTLSDYNDISNLKNTVLVYFRAVGTDENRLLLLDDDYVFSNTNPITIQLNSDKFDLAVGDLITTKLYNEERDSAECPPTPSALGMYPLHLPRIETDYSFQTPVEVVVGHDGSRTVVTGDIQDQILLEFETRIYNSCQKQFREANSHPLLSVYNVRAGAFRQSFGTSEYSDLLRNSFINWSKVNETDYLINEFYDENNSWSWNYRGNSDVPGHWKGWYEYYYDTVRPHTHPWEMLGFVEQPTWWTEQYGVDYSSSNTALWQDLESGVIRQGTRENVTNSRYALTSNVFARPGLSKLLPVDSDATLRAPVDIANTGVSVTEITWSNRRIAPLDVTDQIFDAKGNNGLPNGVLVTHGNGASERITWDVEGWDLYNRGLDSFAIANIYVRNENIDKNYQLYNYSFSQLGNSTIIVDKEVTSGTADFLGDQAVAITVTGVPLLNPRSTESWNSEGEWAEDSVANGVTAEYGTYAIYPEHAGLEQWDSTVHSPIVAWSFDGLPIYGPFGYAAYDSSGNAVDSSIARIQSAFDLKTGTRSSGPGGAYTGTYIQDYEFNGSYGYARPNHLNLRYGVTPESPDTPIYFYVATLDTHGDPMFPYVFGGVKNLGSDNTYEGKYYSYVIEADKNNTGTISTVGELATIISQSSVNTSVAATASRSWRFGDGAPVENAWKYSSAYPFAVVESLVLSKPGKFATAFSDPTATVNPRAESSKLVNTTDRKVWDYTNPAHFRIHGDIDQSGNTIANSGYTQFIYSWLAHQGLVIKTDFADKLRTVNTKLAHRVEGFTDKDTLRLRSDQFSSTGSANSLLIPEENFEIAIHSSPYKNRNFYSGVIVQKLADGYKVRGYDKNLGYFNILKPNKFGRTSEVEVGGEPAEYTQWEPNTSYSANTIVSYNGRYWQADTFVTSSQNFITSLWKPLSSLPQRGAVRGVVYQDSLPQIDRVDYETHFSTHQEVFEFLIALGKYNESIGFSFGEYDVEINDTRNWAYGAKQFLFWVAGGWENNNTLELSPMANRVIFKSTTGAVAKINRIERNQFSLLDENGQAIQPSECEIVRIGTTIEIMPPQGKQIYACLLYTRQIEHAIVIDNVTDFNDTIYNPLFNQKQDRLRVKGKRTANWDGRFSSEGFIIQDDELKPNLDNLAQSLGRYHELGFIPVEKQLYDQARGLFGYQERDYLTALEIDDDTQFEFYSGMIHEKGTTPALSKIAKSKNIIQGEMTVYDEWAFKVGDFGDLENDQSIELLLDKADFVQDPQLVTLAFPEDTTGVVSEINVIDALHKHHAVPKIELAKPLVDPKAQATAQAFLNNKGQLDRIEVTNSGSGYTESVRLNVITSDVVVSNIAHTFSTPVAQSETLLPANLDGITLGSIEITDHTTSTSNVIIDISTSASTAEVATAISNAFSGTVTASASVFNMVVGSDEVVNSIVKIEGNDFELVNNGTTLQNLGLDAKRYQPKQRFNVTSFDATTDASGTVKGYATTADNITVFVDDVAIDQSNWAYDHGSKTAVTYALVGITDKQKLDPTSDSGIPSTDTVFSGNAVIQSPFNGVTFAIDTDNLAVSENVYSHIDLYIDGQLVTNSPDFKQYEFTTPSTLVIYDVASLPQRKLSAGANVYIVENSTVTLDQNYTGDVPNAKIRIKVSSDDAITAITRSQRLYDITPDFKNDEVILIDIDDKDRFLKKPLGVKDSGLWPTLSNVTFEGINDIRYHKIPNAGYVHKANVDFRAYGVQDIPLLFDDSNLFHPDTGNTIHIASSENNDWNVYKIKDIPESKISYVEMETGDSTSYLYSDIDLFQYTDTNQIFSDDTSRFLDYHLVIKNTAQNEKFVIWTNQEVVNAKQVRISNLSTVSMTEANIVSIAPTVNSMFDITNIQPVAGRITGAAMKPIGNSTVAVITNTSTLVDGDQVMLATPLDTELSEFHVKDFTVANVVNGSFTITVDTAAYNQLAAVNVGIAPGIIDSANLTVSHYNKTKLTLSSAIQLIVANADVESSITVGDTITQTGSSVTGVVTSVSEKVIALNTVSGTFVIGDEDAYLISSTAGNLSVHVEDVASTHPYRAGDTIKLDAGAYTGVYTVESATEYDVRINSPYIASQPVTGKALTPNFTITTDKPHKLDTYNGKFAIHNSDLRYYNKTFEAVYAKGNVIQVVGLFPFNSATLYSDFRYTANADVTASVGELITQTGTTAQGEVVSVDGTTLILNKVSGTFDLTSGTTIQGNVSGELNVTLTSVTNPSLSTVDHDMIYPNGAKIKIDNTQSADGIAESFNRRQAIMRGWTKYSGSFGMAMSMLKIPDINSIKDTRGATPYVTDLKSISMKGLTNVGDISIPDSVSKKIGFNRDTGTSILADLRNQNMSWKPKDIGRTNIQPKAITQTVSGKPANSTSNPTTVSRGLSASGTSFNLNGFTTTSIGPYGVPFNIKLPDLSGIQNIINNPNIGVMGPLPGTQATPTNTSTQAVTPVRTQPVGPAAPIVPEPTVRIPVVCTFPTPEKDKCWEWAGVAPPPGYSYEACNKPTAQVKPSKPSTGGGLTFGGSSGSTPASNTGGTNTSGPVLNPGVMAALKSICNTKPSGTEVVEPPSTSQPPSPPAGAESAYAIDWEKETVNEGQTVKAWVTTANVAPLTTLYIKVRSVSSGGIKAEDIDTIKDLSIGAINQTGNNGYVDVVDFVDNSGYIKVKTANDGTAGPIEFKFKLDEKTETDEKIRLDLYTDLSTQVTATRLLTVKDTSTTPVQPPVNRSPVAVNDEYNAAPATAVSGNIFANDSDPDGDQISVVSHTEPSSGTLVLNDITGAFTYTPNSGFSGTDTFEYTISDGDLTDSATVTLVVDAPANNCPNAVNDSFITEYATPMSGNVLANDSDPDGDVLTVTVSQAPTKGTLDLQTSGNFTYTPNSGFSGTDTFRYTIDDNNGCLQTATVTITVKEQPVQPDPPPQTGWCRYFETQSTNSANKGMQSNVDYYYYDLTASGVVTLVFYNWGAADKIEIHQVTSKTKTGGIPLTSTSRSQRATGQEKSNLINSGINVGASATMRDYEVDNSKGSGFVKWAGKITTGTLNPANGRIVRVKVTKPSSVYAYYIDTPCVGGKTLTELNGSSSTQFPPVSGGGNPNNINIPNLNQYAGSYGSSATPIFQPVSQYTGKVSSQTVGGPAARNFGGRGLGFQAGVNFQQNFSGWSQHPMSGFRNLPSIFRRNDVKLTNTDNYGKYAAVSGSKYVSSTHQRISGGEIIPLAQPVAAPIRILAKPIRTTTNDGSILSEILTVISNGKDLVVNAPRTITTGLPNSEPIRAVAETTGTVTIFDPPAFNAEPTPVDPGYPGVTVDDPNAPADVIYDYATQPVITIQPTKRDGNISIPVGKPAFATMYKPTPMASIPAEATNGVNPGDQIVINGTPVTIAGGGYTGVLNSLKCADIPGVTVQGAGAGFDGKINITSCSSAPIKFANGCSGEGRYSEILDFHVVRSFTDGITTPADPNTVTTIPSYTTTTGEHLITGVFPVQQTTFNLNSSAAGNTTSTTSTATSDILNSPTSTLVPETSSITPEQQLETSTTGSRHTHTGGTGYSIGDRLRLVGGTPVSDPYGSVVKICINNSGANYSSAENIRITIGDGNTPGSGAVAGTVTLDPVTGGIAAISLTSGGVGYDVSKPPSVSIVDLGASTADFPATHAELSAKVETTPFKVPRVAKFRVTAVNTQGGILGLQVIDRGIYKQLPPDLDRGLPLEYDYTLEGDVDDGELVTSRDFNSDGKINTKPGGSGLGQWDPLNNYAFLDTPASALSNAQSADAEPGPTDGFDPNRNAFFGGSGARLYFTSRNIPDCSQKGTAKDALGLPDIVTDPDYPTTIADIFNNALKAAGFDPEDIQFSVDSVNDDVSLLVLDAPGYDGVEFGEETPGFLDKLGIPIGSYDSELACMVMTNETSSPDYNPTPAGLRDLADENGFTISNIMPAEVLTITCVDSLDLPGGTIFAPPEWYLDDDEGGPGSGGDGSPGDQTLTPPGVKVEFFDDLYQYELRTIFGDPVTTPYISQGAKVHYLESQRYRTEGDILRANVIFPAANIPVSANLFDKIWIDEISLTSPTLTAEYKNKLVEGGAKDVGWAHLEFGEPKRWQTDLVDPKYVNEIILYDRTTGDKDFNLDMWDPFKGVLPAFVDAEIHFVSEQDPVVYNSKRARFTRDNVGQVWWDTSTIRYDWYEQGPNRERWINWGSVFPGSTITLYEWVESDTAPLQYTGTGTPKNGSEYLVERRIDRATGQYKNYYYFWVQNKEELSVYAKDRYLRKFNTYDLAKYLADPIRQGINMISFVSSGNQESKNQASFFVSNLSQILREDEQILQINLSRNLNPLGLKHTSWKLLREADAESVVPEDLSNKLIDSLCEQDATGRIVPAENLSEVERYGIGFRPRQTMFKDPIEARRVMHYALNEILAELKLNSLHPQWKDKNYIGEYVEVSNWYAVQYTDSLNNKVRYDSTYKPIYTVASVKALDTLKQSKLVDGTVVMVRASKTERYQLWRWNNKQGQFTLIAMQNETAKISKKIFTDPLTVTMQTQLREFLQDCKDHLFEGISLWNKLFFALVKYAYGEQLQLPWAFKTSYIYVDKEESDLDQRQGYRPDNFDSVVEYLNEVKPYTAKIREYKDGKKTPIDYISDQMVSDFDKPPYADPVEGTVRTLDRNNELDANILASHPDYVKWNSLGDIVIDDDRSDLAKWDALGWQTGRWDSSLSENDSPVRTNKVKMVFDRVDWRLLDANYDASTTSHAQGTATMIAYLNSDSDSNVASNANVSMSGRIFKFDPEVKTQFVEDIANSNVDDVTDVEQLENAYLSGALTGTLDLVKEKVGGGFRGEELDANVFTKVVPGEDPLTLQSAFGFDTNGWDSAGSLAGWDTSIEVQNFEGVLAGETTFRRSGITYDGFDSVTFQRVMYGEERPEEMALFSPLENLIMRVSTTPLAFGNGADQPATAAIALGPYPVETSNADANNVVTVSTVYQGQLLANNDVLTVTFDGNSSISGDYTISNVQQLVSSTTFTIDIPGYVDVGANVRYSTGPEVVNVDYLVHYDMFGNDEYLRIKGDASTTTTLSRDFEIWDDKLFVSDPAMLPDPRPGIPGILWVSNSERIVYRTKNNVTGEISDITRGTRGTTIEKHIQGVSVISGYYTEVFDDVRNENAEFRDPDESVWINSNMLSITDVSNRTLNDEIAAWVQGDSVSPIGFDAKGWDINPWDSV